VGRRCAVIGLQGAAPCCHPLFELCGLLVTDREYATDIVAVDYAAGGTSRSIRRAHLVKRRARVTAGDGLWLRHIFGMSGLKSSQAPRLLRPRTSSAPRIRERVRATTYSNHLGRSDGRGTDPVGALVRGWAKPLIAFAGARLRSSQDGAAAERHRGAA
jgi:hypothetical protein